MHPFPSALLLAAAATGGGGGTTYTTLSTTDHYSTITLSGGNLVATKSGSAFAAAYAAHGKSTGKWMFEVTITTAGSGEVGIGLAGAGGDPTQFPGDSARSIGYNSNNGVVLGNSTGLGGSSSGFTPSATVVMSCYVDCDANLVWFAHNGTIATTSSNPATGTGGTSISGLEKALYPLLSIPNTGYVLTANFGATSFAYPVSGFNGWSAVAAPVDLTAFRSVRMVPQSPGYFSHAVAEFELLTSSGGSTIFTGGTPGASGTTTAGTIAGAYDGNTTTYHAQGSTGSQNQKNVWFGYDFGSSGTRNVTHIALRSRDGGGGAQNQCPTQANLWASSDNATFWKVATGIAFATWGANTPGDRQVVAL